MKWVVTGTEGQVARALRERAAVQGIEILCIGRPQLDLARPESVRQAIVDVRPVAVISAAAYTAVDQAETDEDTAFAINGIGAGAVAAAAAACNAPVIHLSTDYVFDGTLDRPYREDDPIAPMSAYGRSKVAGEAAVLEATGDTAILRTAWVYSPFGKNFARTMLRLAGERDTVRVVADQIGAPTSAEDIADGIYAVARNLLRSREESLRGIFHMSAGGEAAWADFAEAIFIESATRGGPAAAVERIPSDAYPTPARRPPNSRLDCEKIRRNHGVVLPNWRASVGDVVARILAECQEEKAV